MGNGLQFSYSTLQAALKPDNVHSFDITLCATQHRTQTNQQAHPWTHGPVEKMNHIIKSATLKLFHYKNIDEYSEPLAKFLNYYNFEKKLKCLKFKSPYDKILSEYKKIASLFLGNPCGYCVGAKQYKPMRNAVAHTARLTQPAKDKLSSVYENIKGRINTLFSGN